LPLLRHADLVGFAWAASRELALKQRRLGSASACTMLTHATAAGAAKLAANARSGTIAIAHQEPSAIQARAIVRPTHRLAREQKSRHICDSDDQPRVSVEHMIADS
jgi:hypothetical protein